jgi:hypothetical protein
MQLQGLATRWPDLPPAVAARKLLAEYDARSDRPWERDDLAEQRRFLVAESRALDHYGSSSFPPQYAKEQPEVLRKAIELWQLVRDDSPDSPAGKEAAQRIPELERKLNEHGGQ